MKNEQAQYEFIIEQALSRTNSSMSSVASRGSSLSRTSKTVSVTDSLANSPDHAEIFYSTGVTPEETPLTCANLEIHNRLLRRNSSSFGNEK